MADISTLKPLPSPPSSKATSVPVRRLARRMTNDRCLPDALQNLYGVRPVSLQVFLRISPACMCSGYHATGSTNHQH